MGEYATVTPSMNFKDTAAAIDFYIKAFGAVERFRLESPGGGIMHAEILLGDTIIMMSDEVKEMGALTPESAGGSPTLMSIESDAVDAAFKRAVDAGATVLSEPQDYFWGHRTCYVLDPFGYRWSITTVIEEVSAEEIQRRAAELYS